jgi:hypothetical protein
MELDLDNQAIGQIVCEMALNRREQEGNTASEWNALTQLADKAWPEWRK